MHCDPSFSCLETLSLLMQANIFSLLPLFATNEYLFAAKSPGKRQ